MTITLLEFWMMGLTSAGRGAGFDTLGLRLEGLFCFCGAHFSGCANLFLDFLRKTRKKWA